jgi:hypothetical protein
MEESSEFKAPTTRSIGLQYGAILALASVVLFLIPAVMANNPFKSPWNWIGAGVTILVIVLAHKKFKDEGDGFMSYGQGLAIAFWISLIATLVSILFSFGYTTFIDNGPFELFMEHQEDEMIAHNAPENIIKTSHEWTRILLWVIGTVLSILFSML